MGSVSTGLCTLGVAILLSAGGVGAYMGVAAHASTRGQNDRTAKLDLIERLRTAPETLILGSSRGRRAAPSYLQKLSGRTGFNAAVTSGTAADAWVMIRHLTTCFPGAKKLRYLWFVDVGIATNGVNPDLRADPRGRKYLRSPAGTTSVGSSGRPACRSGDRAARSPYNPDGSLGPSSTRNLPEKAKSLDEAVAKLAASVRAHPLLGAGGVDPRRYVYFERALAFMNRRGERPVIVRNPIHPVVLAELRKVGFPARRTSDTYLARLHKRFDFVVVDAQDIRRWVARLATSPIRRTSTARTCDGCLPTSSPIPTELFGRRIGPSDSS